MIVFPARDRLSAMITPEELSSHPKGFFKRFVDSANAIALAAAGVFVVSFLIILAVSPGQPPQPLHEIIAARFFDIIGVIAFFVCFLFLGMRYGD